MGIDWRDEGLSDGFALRRAVLDEVRHRPALGPNRRGTNGPRDTRKNEITTVRSDGSETGLSGHHGPFR